MAPSAGTVDYGTEGREFESLRARTASRRFLAFFTANAGDRAPSSGCPFPPLAAPRTTSPAVRGRILVASLFPARLGATRRDRASRLAELSARLVIVSACQSAQSMIAGLPHEELSIATAMLAARGACAIASLWAPRLNWLG